jgi:hypothetical protein
MRRSENKQKGLSTVLSGWESLVLTNCVLRVLCNQGQSRPWRESVAKGKRRAEQTLTFDVRLTMIKIIMEKARVDTRVSLKE